MKITTKTDAPATDAGATSPPPPPDFGADRDAVAVPASREKLESVIIDMDALAQAGFGEICAIAKMALQWMEHPDGIKHIEVVAQALRSIWARSESINDSICFLASDAGCSWVDENSQRRFEAYVAAKRG